MLDLNFIENFARENNLPLNKRRIIAEYLQTIILEAISASTFNEDIIFMGGTCLRFVYNIQRFSEDLDFDLNVDEKKFNFNKFCIDLQRELSLQNLAVAISKKENEILYRASVKFSGILFQANLSSQKTENLMINIEIDKDPSKHLITEVKIINHFNKIFPLLVNNKETLFAEKMKAVLFRKYTKARDYFDLVFFLSDQRNQPNYKILQEKGLKIYNLEDLNSVLQEKISKLKDFDEMMKDLQSFIFFPQQLNLVRKFLESYKK